MPKYDVGDIIYSYDHDRHVMILNIKGGKYYAFLLEDSRYGSEEFEKIDCVTVKVA
jgi:hypothetical protein